MRRLAALAALLALALAGCGGGEERGTATLWVTRDRGAVVVLDTTVPAGQTLLRALRAKVEVETRYGGRFVQAIAGVAGSASAQRDWFWFVNGYEGDTSAAEYVLHDGDVAWWDYRSWARRQREPVVVGAFPEPFRHGWKGKRRPAAVRYEGDPAAARRLAELVGAQSVERLGVPAPPEANLLEVRTGPARLTGSFRAGGGRPGDPVRFVIAGSPDATRRYSVP